MEKIKKKGLYLILGFIALLGLGQQCAKVDLEFHEAVEFVSLSKSPLRLDPPIENEEHRRIIFIVDMSYSMVSGPCPQDINENFSSWENPYDIYDPNKNTGNPDDHRGDGIDCILDPTLPIKRSSVTLTPPPDIQGNPKRYYKTHLGMDHEKNRFKILKNWIQTAREKNTELLKNNTKIMIIPVSGGKAQPYLEQKWKDITGLPEVTSLLNLRDPKIDQLMTWLEKEHDDNLETASTDDVWRYEHRTLGTSTPGVYLPDLYSFMQEDMRKQNNLGLLGFTDYQIITITDGNLTPIKNHIDRTLRFYNPCSSCALDRATCDTACNGLITKMNRAWGLESDNDLERMDFRFGLLQSLPTFFGSGFLKVDFLHVNASRYKEVYPEDKPFFLDLEVLFKRRQARLKHWSSDSQEAPFRLVGDNSSTASYKVTDFYLLNLNYRMNSSGKMEIDSDGDGVPDAIEKSLGLDPQNPRTNQYVLDIFLANPSFKERAESLALSNTCDPSLDTDGDSLNECEERLLGTNPFDFDTDGDGIPDSWELLYGLNPLAPDNELDSNGDGITNKIAFNSGIPPQPVIKNLHESTLSRYEVNYQGKEKLSHPLFGEMLVELYEVLLKGLPTHEGLVSKSSHPLFLSRPSSLDASAREKNRIPYEHQLLSVVSDKRYNTLTALARIVSINDPERVFWRIYKAQIPLSNVYTQPRLDLSLFKQIKAKDRND
jgi:hypothetical protein